MLSIWSSTVTRDVGRRTRLAACLFLAGRAPVRRPPADRSAGKFLTASRAGAVFASNLDEPSGVHAAAADRRAHRSPDLAPKPVQILGRQRRGGSRGGDPGLP